VSQNDAYRIRLRGFWTASEPAPGRTRFARRFGKPRTLDADESLWLVGLNPPGPVVAAVNGTPIGETRKPRSFAFEISSALQQRNEATLEFSTSDLSPNASEVPAVDLTGVRAQIDPGEIALEVRRLSLEPVRPDDFEFAHDLTRSNMSDFVTRHWGGWDADIFRTKYDRTQNSLIFLTGSPVGFVRLAVDADRLVLEDLQIVPTLQNAGIGTWALKELEAVARRRGLHAIRLRCFRENLAYHLYRRFGFAVVEPSDGADWLEKPVSRASETPCDSTT